MVKVSVCMECKQWKRGYQDRWNPPFNKHYCVQCWTRFLARASPAEANLVQKPGTKAARYGRTYGCESCGRHKPGWMDEHGNLFYCQPCWQSYETGKPYRPAQRATTQVQKDQRKGDGKGTTKKRQQKKNKVLRAKDQEELEVARRSGATRRMRRKMTRMRMRLKEMVRIPQVILLRAMPILEAMVMRSVQCRCRAVWKYFRGAPTLTRLPH